MNPQIVYALQKSLYAFWYIDCAYNVLDKDYTAMFHALIFMCVQAYILQYFFGEGDK